MTGFRRTLPIRVAVTACCVLRLTAQPPNPRPLPLPQLTGTADIIYSARYYHPGARPSHYKIYSIDVAGAERRQLTVGDTDDQSPVWLDEDTILFVSDNGRSGSLCTVKARGGPVSELLVLPGREVAVGPLAPDHRSVVYSVFEPRWRTFLLDITTRETRPLENGGWTVWSPDSRRLYLSMWASDPHRTAQILDVATGHRVGLSGELGAATWLDDDSLVAEAFARDPGQPRLVVLQGDGTVKREIPLPISWRDDLSPFADALFTIPEDRSSILYGRHAGGSTEGPAQRFYRVPLNGGEPTVVGDGHDLAWSPDHRFFLTGAGRDLAALDHGRRVWTSPLSVVRLADGRARVIVKGLVSVAGFDWRRPPSPLGSAHPRRAVLEQEIALLK